MVRQTCSCLLEQIKGDFGEVLVNRVGKAYSVHHIVAAFEPCDLCTDFGRVTQAEKGFEVAESKSFDDLATTMWTGFQGRQNALPLQPQLPSPLTVR